THGRVEDLRSLGVLIHNWPAPAIEWMFAQQLNCSPSPLFAAVENSAGPFYWPSASGSRTLSKMSPKSRKAQKLWFDELRERVGRREGVSQALKSVVVG